jgi:hypothetical protein
MPWSRSTSEHSQAAKALRRKWETEGPDNRLFDACFRIQREASEAAGRHISLIVENVRGAQPWVGPAKANYGSFYLWGDVDMVGNRIVIGGASFASPMIGAPARIALKQPGNNGAYLWKDRPVPRFNDGENAHKTAGGSWFRERNGEPQPGIRHEDRGIKVASEDGRRTDVGLGARFTSRDCGVEGTKIGGDWFSDPNSTCRKHGSRSNARKAASAQIAKIPLPLSQFIASAFKPKRIEAAA